MLGARGGALVVLEVVAVGSSEGPWRSEGADAGLGFGSAGGSGLLNVIDCGCELIPIDGEDVEGCCTGGGWAEGFAKSKRGPAGGSEGGVMVFEKAAR